MWAWDMPDLESLADNNTDNGSPVYLLEDGKQLPLPHTIHASIVKQGRGRFSHWGRQVCFAPLDNGDPNRKRDSFYAFIAEASQPASDADPARCETAALKSANFAHDRRGSSCVCNPTGGGITRETGPALWLRPTRRQVKTDAPYPTSYRLSGHGGLVFLFSSIADGACGKGFRI